jgi:hypothetical protein
MASPETGKPFSNRKNKNQSMAGKIFLAAAVLLSNSFMLNAQTVTPEKLGFKSFRVTDKELGQISFYVSNNKIEQAKPVLLYLDGSGPYPLFQYAERGLTGSVPFDFKTISGQYHVVLISKPGVPFVDSLKQDVMTGNLTYKAPEIYKQKLSLQWRVNAADLVLKKLHKELKVHKRKVAVLGISEGFQVGAKLATVNKSITHLMLFAGNGLTQFYDFIIRIRTDAQKGFIPEDAAQRNIDSLYKVIRDIYANPVSTNKEWSGHTYLRWSSFSANNPSENILPLGIPVYIVGCSNDRNMAVLGTDYLFLESIRLKKTNITYKVYPYDHSFNEQLKNEKRNVTSVKNHTREVIEKGFLW